MPPETIVAKQTMQRVAANPPRSETTRCSSPEG